MSGPTLALLLALPALLALAAPARARRAEAAAAPAWGPRGARRPILAAHSPLVDGVGHDPGAL